MSASLMPATSSLKSNPKRYWLGFGRFCTPDIGLNVSTVSGPRLNEPGSDKIIWEHGRRNFALRAEGILAIVCPVRDDSDVAGIGIFKASVEEVDRLIRDDP